MIISIRNFPQKKVRNVLTETITSGLEKYRIGPKLRALRLGKKLGLADLAEHTGLSPALLSKIERGQIFPTLPTLLRIAMVYGVGLDHFFGEETGHPVLEVVRAVDRLKLPNQPDSPLPAYHFESLNFPVNKRDFDAYLATFPPGAGSSPLHSHPGAEFIYVVSGSLLLSFDFANVTLQTGDAAHFDPSQPHSYCQAGTAGCTVIVVTIPG